MFRKLTGYCPLLSALFISLILISGCSRPHVMVKKIEKKTPGAIKSDKDSNTSDIIWYKKAVPYKPKLIPPLNFLVLGDSMIGGYFGAMLVRQLKKIPGIRARRIFRKSTGLSELHPYNWPGKSVHYIRRYRPDILVSMFGSNDTMALRLRNGKLIYYYSSQDLWKKIYTERVISYLKRISPLVKVLYVMGQPSTGHRILARRYPVLNNIYREACKKFSNVMFIPSWEWTTEKGKYALVMKDKKGKWGRVKSRHDHIHHTPFGGRVLSELFIDYIKMDVDFSRYTVRDNHGKFSPLHRTN